MLVAVDVALCSVATKSITALSAQSERIADPRPGIVCDQVGQACSVARRRCWDDGWSEQTVARGLTLQLFGAAGSGSPSGARNSQRQVARQSGCCSLSQAGRAVFDGPCALKQALSSSLEKHLARRWAPS